jgi:hypothetical protein
MSSCRAVYNRGLDLARDNEVSDLPYYPCPEEVPDWSPETKALLNDLTLLERSFVEWLASGMNAAEAYRKATGTEYKDRETDTTRMNGYIIRSRPRVKMAIDAAMKDMNFAARLDRATMLQRLQVALEKAEKSDKPADQDTVARIIKTIAELTGELVRHTRDLTDGSGQRGNVRIRITEILADADRYAGRTPPGTGGPVQGDGGQPARPALGAD